MSTAQSSQIIAIVAVIAIAMAGILFCQLMKETDGGGEKPPEALPPLQRKPTKRSPVFAQQRRQPPGSYANRPDPRMEELITLLQGDRAAAERLTESAGSIDIAIAKLLRDRQ